MSNLEELTAKIKERLSQQNGILKNCLDKYQKSQIENKKIADSIKNITTQLTTATNNLETIQKNHNDFNIARANKIQEYETEKQKMKSDYDNEKQTLEEEKKRAIQEESRKAETIKKELEQKAIEAKQQGIEEQKKLDEGLQAQAEQKHQEEIRRKEEESQNQKAAITEFENKLKNANLEVEQRMKKMEDQHRADLATVNSNEEKIQKLTDQNKELHIKITNLNKEHEGKIKELADKAKLELEKAKTDSIKELEDQKSDLDKLNVEKIEVLQKKHEEDIIALTETMNSASSAAAVVEKAKLEEAEGKLKLCNEKFQQFEIDYKKNEEELNNIEEQFKDAENIAANALENSVNKLAEENKVLQDQIKKMMGDDSSSSGKQQEQPQQQEQQQDQQGQKKQEIIDDNESKDGDVPPPAPQSQFTPPSPSHIEQAKKNKVVKKFLPRKLQEYNQSQHTFAIVQGAGSDVAGNVTGAQINSWVNTAGHNKQFNFGLLNKKFIDLFMNSAFYVSNGMEKYFSTANHIWEREMHKAIAAFWVNSGRKKIIQLLKSKLAIESLSQNDIVGPMNAWQKELNHDLPKHGGYKHGKKSNKRNKRSLKSKLSARKFSLKKRSKRNKKKGKSKKRRKSIKIRI